MKIAKKSLALILALIMLVVFIGCGKKTEQTPSTSSTSNTKLNGTFKLGVTLALSGPYVKGQKVHNAAVSMAIEDVNKSGILGDAKIEMIQVDSLSTPAGAINGTQKLINTDKVQALLSIGDAAQALVSAPIAQKAGVLNIQAVGNKKVTETGNFIFNVINPMEFMVPAVLKKVVADKNIKTVAMFTQKDYPSAVECAAVRRSEFAALGAKIVIDEEGLKDETDFTNVITKIRQAEPDMVVFDGTPPRDPLFVKQLKDSGYKGVLVTGVTGSSNGVIGANKETYEGVISAVGWIPGLPGESAKAAEFGNRMKENKLKADQYGSGIYDSIFMLAYAIKKAGSITDVDAIRDALTTVEYEGVMGKVKFDEKRLLTVPTIVTQVKNGELKPYGAN